MSQSDFYGTVSLVVPLGSCEFTVSLEKGTHFDLFSMVSLQYSANYPLFRHVLDRVIESVVRLVGGAIP